MLPGSLYMLGRCSRECSISSPKRFPVLYCWGLSDRLSSKESKAVSRHKVRWPQENCLELRYLSYFWSSKIGWKIFWIDYTHTRVSSADSKAYNHIVQHNKQYHIKVLLNSVPFHGFRSHILLTDSKVRITLVYHCYRQGTVRLLFWFVAFWTLRVVLHDVCSFFVPCCDHMMFGKNVTRLRVVSGQTVDIKWILTYFPVWVMWILEPQQQA